MAGHALAWIKQTALMNSTGNDQYPTTAVDSAGNVYVSYQTTGTVSGGTFIGGTGDIVVFKLDSSGNMVWIKEQAVMNSTLNDLRPYIAVDANNNVYVSYQTTGTVSGGTLLGGTNDIVVFKLDSNGNMVWIKEQAIMNSTGNDQVPTITVDITGNVYVSYYTTGTVSGGTFIGAWDIVVFKLDSNGNMVWIKEQAVMNSTGTDNYPTIAVDSSNNVYVSYITTGTVSGGTFLGGTTDIVVFKLDANGNMVWIKEQAIMNSTGDDLYPKIAVDSNSNVYVSYYTTGTVSGGTFIGGASDIVVFKLDSNGNMVWIKEQAVMNSTGPDYNPTIAVDSSSNVYVSYYTNGTVSGGTFIGGWDIVVFKLDSNGNMVWIKGQAVMNSAGDDRYPTIAIDGNNNIFVSYFTTGTTSGGTFRGGTNDIVVMKFYPADVPDAPTAVSALARNAQAIVSWTPPSNNGGAGITSYKVTSSPGGFTAITANGNITSATVTGLTNGTSYTFTVTASNSAGTSIVSSPSSSITPNPYPYAPTVVLATVYSAQQVFVSWTAPTYDGGSVITSYTVTSSPGDIKATTANGSTTTAIVSGLTSGIAYTFTVVATNANGAGPVSSPSSSVIPMAVPYMPTAVTATAGDGQATVSWTAPADNGGYAITSYTVTSSPGGLTATTANGSTTSATVTGLTNGLYYSFTVVATNSNGNSFPSVASSYVKPGPADKAGHALAWIKQTALMNSTGSDSLPTTAVDLDGNVYVSYNTTGTVSGGTFLGGTYDIVVFKLDSNGNMVWIKEQAVMNSTGNDQYPTIAVDSSNNIYVAYQTTGTVSGGTLLGGTYDVVVFKLDSNGNTVWIKETAVMNSTGTDQSPTIAVDSSSNVYVSYNTTAKVSGGTFIGGNDIVVFKLDSSGNMMWIKEQSIMNSTLIDNSQKIALDSNSNIYVAYQTTGTVSGGTFIGGYDIVVFKLDSNGNMVWIKEQAVMNSTGNDVLPTIAVDSAGNMYVSYQTAGTVSGGTFIGGTNDIVVFKLDSSGNMVWIKEQAIMNSTGNDQYPTIAVDNNSNVYVSYQTTGTVSGGTFIGGYDIVVFKLDSNGNMVWIKEQAIMNSAGNDQYPTIAIDGNNNIFVSYHTTGIVSSGTFLGGTNDIVVMKFVPITVQTTTITNIAFATQATGVRLAWNGAPFDCRVYRDTQSSGATKSLLGLGSSSFYIDTTNLAFNTTYYYFVAAYDGTTEGTPTMASYTTSNGAITGASVTNYAVKDGAKLTWTANGFNVRVYRDTDPSGASKQLLATVNGATLYNDATTPSPDTTYYYFLYSVDANSIEGPMTSLSFYSGAVLSWIKQTALMNSTGADTYSSTAVDSAGNMYVSYYTNGTVSGGTFIGGTGDIVVFKLDTNGNMVWIKEQAIMNSTGNDLYPKIAVDSNSNVYVSYYTTGTVSGGTNIGGNDIVVFKLDSSGNMAWIKEQAVMNSTGSDQYPTIAADNAGNIYVSYYTDGTVSGGTFIGGTGDIVVFKLDSSGNMVWIKEQAIMNSTLNDLRPNIAVDSNNVYVSYYTSGTVSGGTFIGGWDIVVFKLDSSGNIVWIKETAVMNSTGSDILPTTAVDSSSNVYVSYYTTGTVSGGTFIGGNDIVVFKLDSNGNMVWIKQQAIMNSTGNDYGPTIALDSSSNVYVSYFTDGTVSGGTFLGGYDIVVFKLDTNGNMVWIKEQAIMNGIGSEYSPTIAVDSGSNVYVSYYTNSTVSGGTFIGSQDIVVMKFTQGVLATVPDAPTAVTATAGNAQATVSWTAPTSNGGSAITSYTVISSPGNVRVTTNNGSTTTATVTGLMNGTAYTFTVVATNAIGNSAASTASASVTPATVPGAPTAVTATAGNAQATVSWTAPISNGGSSITSYTVISSPGDVRVTTNNGSTTTATVTGLMNGTAYTFTVVATNAIGNSSASTASASVRPVSPTGTIPDAPTGLITARGNRSITVSWRAPYNGGSPITGYTVTASPGGASQTTTTTSVTFSNLTIGSSFTYTVKATNINGDSVASAPSSTVVVATVPSAPRSVLATPFDKFATVSWDAPSDFGGSPLVLYTVTSSPDNVTRTTRNRSIDIIGLTNNRAYTFTVTATTSVGEGASSSPSNSVTPVASTADAATATAAVEPGALSAFVATQSAPPATLFLDIKSAYANQTINQTLATTTEKVEVKAEFIAAMRSYVSAPAGQNAVITVPAAETPTLFENMTTGAIDVILNLPTQVILPVFTGTSATINLQNFTTDGSEYLHVELPIGYTMTLVDGTNSRTLLFDGSKLVDTVTQQNYYIGDEVPVGGTYYNINALGSVNLHPLANGQSWGDPYITTVSNKTYKLPDMDAPIRYYQNIIDGKLLTINAKLKTTTSAELTAQNIASFTALQRSIPRSARNRMAQTLLEGTDTLTFFEKLYIQHGDNRLVLNVWNGVFRIEEETGTFKVRVRSAAGLDSKSPYQKGYTGQALELQIAPSVTLTVAVYPTSIIRNGVMLSGVPQTLAEGNGVIVNVLGAADMRLKSLDDASPVVRIDRPIRSVIETFVDHSGYKKLRVNKV